MKNKKVLILGGTGHAHLYTIKRMSQLVELGLKVIVISPNQFYYSGLAPGVLGRYYSLDRDIINVKEYIENTGARFIDDKIAKISPQSKKIHLQSGQSLNYDILSLNVGSFIPVNNIKNGEKYGTPVKPVKNLLDLRQKFESYAEENPHSEKLCKVLIIGAGAAGVEITGNAEKLCKDLGVKSEIKMITDQSRILTQFSERASKIVAHNFEERGIQIVRNMRVLETTDYTIKTKNITTLSQNNGESQREPLSKSYQYSILLYAVGVSPNNLIGESGIPTDKKGAMIVNENLQSIKYRSILGGGDCITLLDKDLDKVGVYAVKQSPILFHNIKKKANELIKGKRLDFKKFSPQHNYLLILNLGDDTGVLIYNKIIFRCKLNFIFKDWLDTRFLDKYKLN